MDMLGGSPQSDCYLTPKVYTVLTHFRSGFRLCNAAIPPQSAPLNAARQKRILLSRFWGSAPRGTDLGWARGRLCMIACRRWRAGDRPRQGPREGSREGPRGRVGGRADLGWWSAPAKRAT